MHFNDWLFWVSLTAFGTGLYFWIAEHRIWGGVVLTVVGAIGLVYTIREVQAGLEIALSRWRLWAAAGYILIVYILFYAIFYIRRLRSDLDTYVMPRVITAKQTERLRDFLANRIAHSVTVKVDPHDQEAMGYWSQIYNALRGTQWTVETRTDNADPHTLNPGLFIHEQGTNAKPKAPKDDPRTVLQEAFQAAHISVNGGSSASAGEYRLFILVGRRPPAMNVASFRSQIVHWVVRKLATFAC